MLPFEYGSKLFALVLWLLRTFFKESIGGLLAYKLVTVFPFVVAVVLSGASGAFEGVLATSFSLTLLTVRWKSPLEELVCVNERWWSSLLTSSFRVPRFDAELKPRKLHPMSKVERAPYLMPVK